MTEGAPDAFTAVGIPARVVNLNDRHGAANLPFIGAIARVFLVEDNQEEMDGCCVARTDRDISLNGLVATGWSPDISSDSEGGGGDAEPTYRMAIPRRTSCALTRS